MCILCVCMYVCAWTSTYNPEGGSRCELLAGRAELHDIGYDLRVGLHVDQPCTDRQIRRISARAWCVCVRECFIHACTDCTKHSSTDLGIGVNKHVGRMFACVWCVWVYAFIHMRRYDI